MTPKISDEQLNLLIELEKKAKLSPWISIRIGMAEWMRDIPAVVGSHNKTPYLDKEDADFIVKFRNAAPSLLAELKELREENASLKVNLLFLNTKYSEMAKANRDILGETKKGPL